MSKEVFFGNLRAALYEIVPTEEINKIIEVVDVQMAPYDLTVKPHEIVVYDGGDENLIKRFFIIKAAEGLTENSLESYKRALQRAFNTIKKHIKDVTSDDIRILIAKLRIEGRSATYQNFIRRALNSFYITMEKEGLIKENPMVRVACVREPKKMRLPFSEEELELLRVNAGSIRNQCIIEFMYSTGCRVSEMCAINIDEIDFDECKVMVLGKGRKYRNVYFSSRCKVLLQQYLKSRTDRDNALFLSDFSAWKNKNYPHMIGRLSPEGVRRMLKSIGKKANVTDVHPHRFRRTAATLAMKRGMKISDVQHMLGHSDIKTTTIYATTTDDEVKREHDKYLI